MSKKIYLSTYSLKVFDRQEETLLMNFNGSEDFHKFFTDFMEDVYKNVKKTHTHSDRTVLHLALDEPAISTKSNRTVYWYISSGVSGDKFKVRKEGETETAFESNNNHITFRDLFFYLQLPSDKTYGYLIIQKRRDLGAKALLQKALNTYLREKGYLNFNAKITNMLNGRVYERMMSEGNLKSIDFIKKTIPATMEQFYEEGPNTETGTLTTSIRAPFSLGPYWKNFINKVFNKEYKESIIELDDALDSFNEIEFELELNKKIKTFHVLSKGRTQPDVEVSNDLDFKDNEPTTESLVEVSASLIEDMLTLKPNV